MDLKIDERSRKKAWTRKNDNDDDDNDDDEDEEEEEERIATQLRARKMNEKRGENTE